MIILDLIIRIFTLYPLLVVILSVFRNFYDKLHSINGLRKYRVLILAILLSMTIDQLLYLFFDLKVLLYHYPVSEAYKTVFLTLNSLIVLGSSFLLLYLFRHASKKDSSD